MTPQTKKTEQEKVVQETRVQEQFIREVEDRSLPAQEVLNDQQASRDPSEAPVLFVP